MHRYFSFRWIALAVVLLCGAALLPTSGPDLPASMTQSEFRAWSNSLPNEQALNDLEAHLEAMSGPEAVVAWFQNAGFQVDKTTPRELKPSIVKTLKYPDGTYYSLVLKWRATGIGSIFVTNGLSKAEAWLFVHGEGLSLTYRMEDGAPTAPITIVSMRISKTRL